VRPEVGHQEVEERPHAGNVTGRLDVVQSVLHATLRVDHEEASPEVTFRVLDRGPKLTPGEQARAFDLPDETDSGRLSASGVGPFVARNLVEAMGGRVWVRNRHGGGVETAFALPVDAG